MTGYVVNDCLYSLNHEALVKPEHNRNRDLLLYIRGNLQVCCIINVLIDIKTDNNGIKRTNNVRMGFAHVGFYIIERY